ncbi:MAG: LD-carboxypeptidase [Nanoarchaeota archaeon]|nr:LD-carboxypeptidase [Nanoarchaeota archaeon]
MRNINKERLILMIPRKLKKGDTIGIVTPSKPITQDQRYLFDNTIDYLNQLGFNVIYAKNALSIDKYGVSGGTVEQRAEDINHMFSDEKIKAIWCAQGGDTANQILDFLDYELIKNNPKIFMGKSDIDLLSLAINKMTGLITFHAPDPKLGKATDFDFEYSKKAFNERLIKGEIGIIERSSEWKCIRKGKATGSIIGCNITSILKLAGTKYFPDFNKKILFVESYTSGINDIIYELTQLKQIGVFDKISGIVGGYIYGFQDKKYLDKNPKIDKNGNKVNFEDIVLDVTKDYDFPILKINEFGHYCPNAFIPINCKAEVDATDLSIKIIENCVK